ncbi:MAG: type III secretion system stator protein SctL [Myxococcales bacterium]|nr:type III secretion system stator protein SctL [Myxococcales bacterium]
MEEDRRGSPPRVIGKVIKGDVSSDPGGERPALRPPTKGVLGSEQFEAMTDAKRIIEEANRKAQEIKDDAERQREEVFKKARDEAKAEVQAQVTTELARAKMQAGQVIAGAERQALELALKIAEKIIGRDLQRQPELVVDIVATAVENVRTAKAMVLRVNPRDGQLLREKRPALMELIGRTVDVSVKDDPDIKPGGCIIQTEFGTIDAELKTQIEMLRSVLVPDTGKKEVK